MKTGEAQNPPLNVDEIPARQQTLWALARVLSEGRRLDSESVVLAVAACNDTANLLGDMQEQNRSLLSENRRLRDVIEEMPSHVPSNWTDPILTGEHAVKTDATCPQIEALLGRVRNRISDAAYDATQGDFVANTGPTENA